MALQCGLAKCPTSTMSPMWMSFCISSSNSLADDLEDLGEPTVGSATLVIVIVTFCTQCHISAESVEASSLIAWLSVTQSTSFTACTCTEQRTGTAHFMRDMI